MLDRLAMVFILLGICTSLMIIKDILRRPHPVRIMNLVWPITGLYMPFFGWLTWWFFARKSRSVSLLRIYRGNQQPELKQIFSTTSRCAAGCVLGDIVAIPIISMLNYIPFHSLLIAHAILSLILSLIFGVALQFFALRQIEGFSLFRALWRAIKTDVFSLIVYQAGMFLCLELAFRFILHGQIEPRLLSFWFMLQIALMIGFVFAWPANKFLLQRGIKPVI